MVSRNSTAVRMQGHGDVDWLKVELERQVERQVEPRVECSLIGPATKD